MGQEFSSFRTDPQADPKNVVCFGKARFTFLTSRLVRMEYSADGAFEDRATFAVIHRRMSPVRFEKREKGRTLTLRTDALTLTYKNDGRVFSKSNLSVRFRMKGERVEWRPGMKNLGNHLFRIRGITSRLQIFST